MEIFGKKRRKRFTEDENDDFDAFEGFEDFASFDDEEDLDTLEGNYQDIGEYYNVNSYPNPYCKVVNDLDLACLETSILELWANDGKYDEYSDEAIENLTNDDVLEKINHHNK